MTSYFVPGLLVGYILGVASVCGLVALYLLHRPRYEAPTLSRRRNRDRVPEVASPEPEKGAVDYRFINLTGLEGE
jgi:hypothetical protein